MVRIPPPAPEDAAGRDMIGRPWAGPTGAMDFRFGLSALEGR